MPKDSKEMVQGEHQQYVCSIKVNNTASGHQVECHIENLKLSGLSLAEMFDEMGDRLRDALHDAIMQGAAEGKGPGISVDLADENPDVFIYIRDPRAYLGNSYDWKRRLIVAISRNISTPR